jgi:hypothetical protein
MGRFLKRHAGGLARGRGALPAVAAMWALYSGQQWTGELQRRPVQAWRTLPPAPIILAMHTTKTRAISTNAVTTRHESSY